EFLHTDDRAVEQIKETGSAGPWEKEYIHKDGHRVPVLIGVSSLNRRGSQCLTYTIDLTERKKVEAELQASEEKFRLLAEALPQMVWITNSEGRKRFCNQRLYELTGLNRDKNDGFSWIDLIHPDDRSEYLKSAQKAAKNVQPFESEARFKHADGSYRWQLVRGVPINLENGEEPLWFGTWTDMDDQKKYADEIRKRELRFRTLADAIPQIVFTADASGKLDFFNFRWFEYTGLTEAQSTDGAWELLIHPDDLPKYQSSWQTALTTGDSYEQEFRLKPAVGVKPPAKNDQDPGYRWHLARAVALRGQNGEILTWFATWTEIENQKRKRR
ncbi:MAG TPA: PAS domain S-box protein, partial [Chroococcales cyanobacterium]